MRALASIAFAVASVGLAHAQDNVVFKFDMLNGVEDVPVAVFQVLDGNEAFFLAYECEKLEKTATPDVAAYMSKWLLKIANDPAKDTRGNVSAEKLKAYLKGPAFPGALSAGILDARAGCVSRFRPSRMDNI